MLWNREGQPPAVRAFALLMLAGALSGVFVSIFPADQAAPVGLFRLVGVVALADFAAPLVARRPGPALVPAASASPAGLWRSRC